MGDERRAVSVEQARRAGLPCDAVRNISNVSAPLGGTSIFGKSPACTPADLPDRAPSDRIEVPARGGERGVARPRFVNIEGTEAGRSVVKRFQ